MDNDKRGGRGRTKVTRQELVPIQSWISSEKALGSFESKRAMLMVSGCRVESGVWNVKERCKVPVRLLQRDGPVQSIAEKQEVEIPGIT